MSDLEGVSDAELTPLTQQFEQEAHLAAENGAEEGRRLAASSNPNNNTTQVWDDQKDDLGTQNNPYGQNNFDLGEEFGFGSMRQQQQQQQHPGHPPSQAQSQQYAYAQQTQQPANPYQQPYGTTQNPYDRTFLTGVEGTNSTSNLHHNPNAANTNTNTNTSSNYPINDISPSMTISDEELISMVEHEMLEHERRAEYIEAEKARLHLESLKQKYIKKRKFDLNKIQEEDMKIFFAMVQQHQENFDMIWSKKQLEHKLRADDLIDHLKWKHEGEQRELYEALKNKRMPKFSVELLNLRKRQVLLAKAKNYIAAEKIKRKADILEKIEIERIRESAREENQLRFAALLKKQSSDRVALASKLKLEKKQLFEAKAQDFLRLKKRLRNAEAELKKTHIRQQLLAEKKLVPLFSYNAQATTNGATTTNPSATTAADTQAHKNIYSNSRSNVLRNSGLQRMMMNSTNPNTGAANTNSNSSASMSKSNSNNIHAYPPPSNTTTSTASSSSLHSSSAKPLNARDLLAQRSAGGSAAPYPKYGREEKTTY